MCAVCKQNFPRRGLVLYHESAYDRSISIISDILKNAHVLMNADNLICKKCDYTLCSFDHSASTSSSGSISTYEVQSNTTNVAPVKDTICCMCYKVFDKIEKLRIFDRDIYNKKCLQYERIVSMVGDNDAHICGPCHTKLKKYNEVKCFKCAVLKRKHSMVRVRLSNMYDECICLCGGLCSCGVDGMRWMCKKCMNDGVPREVDITGDPKVSCCLCNKDFDQRKMRVFDRDIYNKNCSLYKRLLCDIGGTDVQICGPCHTKLQRYNTVECSRCGDLKMKYLMRKLSNTDVQFVHNCACEGYCSCQANGIGWVCMKCRDLCSDEIECCACHKRLNRSQVIRCRLSNYDMTDYLVSTSLIGVNELDNPSICRSCHQKLISTYICTCCHKRFRINKVMVFSETCYDFSLSRVSVALHSKSRVSGVNGEHICVTCHSRLVNLSLTRLPAGANVLKVVGRGAEFLKAIQEKPEYVCTCCHKWHFRKSVYEFKIGEFDFHNSIVALCLAETVRHRMKILVKSGYPSPHSTIDYSNMIEYLDPDYVYDKDASIPVCQHKYVLQYISEKTDNVEGLLCVDCSDKLDLFVHEYICKTCRKELIMEEPRMPSQAVANGLTFDPVPDELAGITDLERRLVSLRIPFMSIFCLVRYGSQYKIRGGCTNVPATLDQVVDMLPRMSSEVQYYPMKLKKKMAYKSNYMVNSIRRDVVMRAIRWLCENNPLYCNVKLNGGWDSDWASGQYSQFLVGESGIPNMDPDILPGGISAVDVDSGSDVQSKGVQSTSVYCDNERHADNEELSSVGDVSSGSVDQSKRIPSRSVSCDNESQLETDELIEDSVALSKAIETVGQPMSNVLEYEDIGREMYSCAPGENKIPKYLLLDDHFESLAFPDMFPSGNGVYCVSGDRQRKLSMRRYFQQRLLNVDGRFRNTIEYLFCAQYATEIKQIKGDTSIALRMKSGRATNGGNVTAGMLRDVNVLHSLVRKEQAYKFLKNIRGSPPYWQHQLYDLLAMLKSIGIPTWFMTLSAADLHWCEMIEAVSIHSGKRLSRSDIKQMSIRQRSEYLKFNPVTAVMMFQHRVEALFTKYIMKSSNPVGKVKEYVIKIEFQERGSPHAHCLLWVEGAPKIDVQSDDEVCQFIDRYVSCGSRNITDDCNIGSYQYLLDTYQTHSHSAYCRRNHSCRFGFPKPITPNTLISREPDKNGDRPELIRRSREILGRVYTCSENMTADASMEDILSTSGVGLDEYISALKISNRGRSVILARDPKDMNVNACNEEILRLWKANIDFQFVLDEYSTVMYVCSYMMKSERAMGEVLKSVARECRSDPIEEQLKKIGRAFIGNRVFGAPEAAMRILSMWLIKKTVGVVYVDANTRENRTSMPKPANELIDLDENDEDVYMTSVYDRYAARPSSLDNMCLAEFAIAYRPIHDSNDSSTVGSKRSRRGNLSVISLSRGLGRMRLRKKRAVLRVKNFSMTHEPDKFFAANILLYYPWRDESTILSGNDTYQLVFERHKEVIYQNSTALMMENPMIDQAIEMISEQGPPDLLWDTIVPSIEEMNMVAENDDVVYVRNIDEDNDESDDVNDAVCDLDIDLGGEGRSSGDTAEDSSRSALSTLYAKEAMKGCMSLYEYRAHIRNLNPGQRKLIMFNRYWCKQLISKLRVGQTLEGYKLYLGGPGGCGKSHCINLIRRDVKYFLQHRLKLGHDEPAVILTAPTGLAAFNIGGVTLHSAFVLPSHQRRKDSNEWKKTSIMHMHLQNLVMCVIDEISMVGNGKFRMVSETLKQAKNSDSDFGGSCVICVGDFYQLPPIGEAPVYSYPRNVKTPQDMAPLLWDSFMCHNLTDVMRQKDMKFVGILNSIRTKEPTDGCEEDTILKSRELKVNHLSPEYPIDSLHVYARNVDCNVWNNTRIDILDGPLIVSTARDRVIGGVVSISDISLSDNPRQTGSMPGSLRLKTNARVMLTTNIDVADGLTNGAMGTVVHIDVHGGKVRTVVVQFDSPTVGNSAKDKSVFKHLFPQAVPISRMESSFSVRGHSHVRVSRIQFPLVLSWAVTIHKCQGMTLKSIVVQMSREHGAYSPGQAYVAFSRVTSLDNLHILNYDRTQIKVNQQVLSYMENSQMPTIPDIPVSRVFDNSYFEAIKISHLNVAGVLPKSADIEIDGHMSFVDIISLNECHLSPDQEICNSDIGLDNKFQIFRTDRVSCRGGVMLAVDKKYCPRHIIMKGCVCDVIAVSAMCGDDRVVFVSLYRSPSIAMDVLLRDVTYIAATFVSLPLCIIGDFNEDVLSDIRINPLRSLSNTYGLKQIVDKPTRDSGTLIDHIYVKGFGSYVCDVVDCYYSDHDIVTCCLSIR